MSVVCPPPLLLVPNNGRFEIQDILQVGPGEQLTAQLSPSQLHEQLYGVSNPNAKLYTDQGVPLDQMGLLPPNRTVVVTSGEEFVAPYSASSPLSSVPDLSILDNMVKANFELFEGKDGQQEILNLISGFEHKLDKFRTEPLPENTLPVMTNFTDYMHEKPNDFPKFWDELFDLTLDHSQTEATRSLTPPLQESSFFSESEQIAAQVKTELSPHLEDLFNSLEIPTISLTGGKDTLNITPDVSSLLSDIASLNDIKYHETMSNAEIKNNNTNNNWNNNLNMNNGMNNGMNNSMNDSMNNSMNNSSMNNNNLNGNIISVTATTTTTTRPKIALPKRGSGGDMSNIINSNRNSGSSLSAADDAKLGHRAADQRSRDKLKNSITALHQTIPAAHQPGGTKGKKATSRHDIVYQAAAYADYLQKDNQQLEDELNKQTEKLQQLQLSSHEAGADQSHFIGIFVLSEHFTFTFVDATWQLMTSYSMDEVIHKSVKDVSGWMRSPDVMMSCMKVGCDLQNCTQWPYVGVVLQCRKDGVVIGSTCRVEPVYDKNRVIIQYVGTCSNYHIFNPSDNITACDDTGSPCVPSGCGGTPEQQTLPKN